MIGKGSQACRYLISYNQWEQAVWLAKCSLSKDDCDMVLKSWADHLLANRNQVISKGLVVNKQYIFVLPIIIKNKNNNYL